MKSEELAFESMYLSVLGMTENGWQAEKDPEQQHEYRSQQEFHTVFHAVAGSVIRLIGRRVSVQPRPQNLCLCQQTQLQLKQPCRQIHTGVDHCEDNDGVVLVIAHKNVPANTVETQPRNANFYRPEAVAGFD